MARRRWPAAAILSATYASLLRAGPAILEAARTWPVGVLFLPHLLVTYMLVDTPLMRLHPRDWMLIPALGAASLALSLPVSYLYIVAAVRPRRLARAQPPESN